MGRPKKVQTPFSPPEFKRSSRSKTVRKKVSTETIFRAEENANITEKEDIVGPTTELAGEETTDPLSRLRQYTQKTTPTNTNTEPSGSRSVRKQYASTAESVKKLLIADIMSRKDSNVEEMIDLANNAFASLDWLHHEYSDLYAAVRDFISYHSQYSEAKRKLERSKNEVLEHQNLWVRLNEETHSLFKATSECHTANLRLFSLTTQIDKTREVLEKLQKEHAQGERDARVLEEARFKCEESLAFTRDAEARFVRMMEENRKLDEPIKRQFDEAEAGIERSIKALCSLSVSVKTDQA